MDDHSHSGDTAPMESDAHASSSLFERTVLGVLMLLANSARTVSEMMVSPKRFAHSVIERSPRIAPPYSFLILSLLVAGIGIRMAVLFYGRTVDHTLLSSLATTVRSITLEDIFVLTVPCIILVAMAGAGIARWTLPGVPFPQSSVVRAVCYVAGFQFMSIGAACACGLAVKILLGRSSVLPENLFDRAIGLGMLVLLLVSSLPVFHVIRQAGKTRLIRSRTVVGALSGLAAATTLLGVSLANSISFDLESTIAAVRSRQQRENLQDIKVAVRTLSSRSIAAEPEGAAIEITAALVNVSDETVIVPRPFELQHALDPLLSPIKVIRQSPDSDDDAGWIIPPGATRLVRLVLQHSKWSAVAEWRQQTIPICFDCFPLQGNDNIFEVNPIGPAHIVLGELQWPARRVSPADGAQDSDSIAETPPWSATR